ncbi:maleylpyruvate isomerase family mycothiol-dependent enzyme [Streptomyces sp. ST1015]|uniref:maleylpyruvate isomerase family mycothiol-dependent enzyme n=1 Tax=Streptomyces sp. ST1015 TaxID=1848900 RepID=UPI000DD98F21|nr:maleylpyruvate isomerase family mycothiol-dependent enzyme [Streptomyces sp. ST1015]QZZ28233.1 maleylpyruvate isomerase family mycothiol-dependent enzyme [Streptomyces sp. ST1015]
MHTTLAFPDLLRLLDDRSTAFRTAVAAAPRLDVQVPTCPEWTLADLAHHIGEGRRRWATIVQAGPADAPPPPVPAALPKDREAISEWLAESTRQLLDALTEAGPDQGCWTWWTASQSPATTGAVARHQLQQLLVHTYDAQLTVGAPHALPAAIAQDGVAEFLTTCCATSSPWPHTPATLDFRTTDAPAWRLTLSPTGAQATTPPPPTPPTASVEGTASEIVLYLHGRTPVTSLKTTGDLKVFGQLEEWEPEA